MRLILASASPRRAELLRAAGYDFTVVVATVDESIRPGESPAMYVRRLATDKSASAQADVTTGAAGADPRVGAGGHESPPLRTDVVIVGADTAVVIAGEILGKPSGDGESAAMLRRLSGKRHEVLTGVSLRQGAYEVSRVETTAVDVRALSEDEIAWYVASGEGRDKAGAYAIQGLASRFIPRIEGSYSNVVGLPVACVHQLLREISGAQPTRPSPRR